jgi:dipeptidyl aminopeptidase/acylaminoacyl peptidase
MPLRRILDVAWNQGPVIVGAVDGDTSDSLVLFVPKASPRTLAAGTLSTRLSPDGAALAYETETRDQAGAVLRTSYVLDIGSGKLTALGPLADLRWEADGKHLRATEIRADREPRKLGHSRSFRVRWERESGTMTVDGPGSAQIPAPLGSTVAWTEANRAATPSRQCTVFLARTGGVRHSTVGRFCAGIADDRSVRWSPDGRWLAFPHPEPGRDNSERVVVDVVSPDGGRYPALAALVARARPNQLTFPASPAMWFDWSPSGRFLAFDDGTGELHVYDFEAHGVASLGKGSSPTWSPGGAYLLIVENDAVTVLVGSGSTDRIQLGRGRDARWLPPQACAP